MAAMSGKGGVVGRKRSRASAPRGVFLPRVVGESWVGQDEHYEASPSRRTGKVKTRFVVPADGVRRNCESCGVAMSAGTECRRRLEEGMTVAFLHPGCPSPAQEAGQAGQADSDLPRRVLAAYRRRAAP